LGRGGLPVWVELLDLAPELGIFEKYDSVQQRRTLSMPVCNPS